MLNAIKITWGKLQKTHTKSSECRIRRHPWNYLQWNQPYAKSKANENNKARSEDNIVTEVIEAGGRKAEELFIKKPNSSEQLATY